MGIVRYLEQDIVVRGQFDMDWLCYEGEDMLYSKLFSLLYNGAPSAIPFPAEANQDLLS